MPKHIPDSLGSIVPSLYLGIAHQLPTIDEGAAIFEDPMLGYAYGRMGNPTVTECEKFLAYLEDAEEGCVWATSSGLSALQLLVVGLLSQTVKTKRRIVTSPYIYGGSYHQFKLWQEHFGFKVIFVEDPFDLASWEKAIKPGASFVFLETPGNPTVDVFDIAGIAEIAHAHDTRLIVDNTVAVTLQKPLALGADAVLHSVTKAIIGQSTGLGGAIVGTEQFVQEFGEVIDDYHISLGLIMHPLSAWFALLNRNSLLTQMEIYSHNALCVAKFLQHQKRVVKVNYPFLQSNQGYALAKKQMTGGGGLLSFELKDFETARAFVEESGSTILAPHLGHMHDYLVIHPASTTHSKLSGEELAQVKISPGLVRLSVGLGDPQEVLDDFTRVLEQIYT